MPIVFLPGAPQRITSPNVYIVDMLSLFIYDIPERNSTAHQFSCEILKDKMISRLKKQKKIWRRKIYIFIIQKDLFLLCLLLCIGPEEPYGKDT